MPDGVVIESTEARLGPGYAYDAAYDTPLHEATEFQYLNPSAAREAPLLRGNDRRKWQNRNGWIHARMPDKSEAWIPETACMTIR